MPDEVARIGALSNGSNGQRSLESASLHFEAIWRRERRNAEQEPTAEILSERSESKDLCFERFVGVSEATPSRSRQPKS
jgi:hypothetical protein